MFLEIALIMVQVILSIQSLTHPGYLPHPTRRHTLRIHSIKARAFLLKLSRDGIDVHIEILAQEFADFGVFVVAA